MLSKNSSGLLKKNSNKQNEETKTKRQFIFLFNSTLSLLKKDTGSKVSSYNDGLVKRISISNSGYTFHISFIPNLEQKTAKILISEESMNAMLRIKLKINFNKNHCRIISISKNRLLYTFRIIDADVIEDLIISLVKYL